MFVPSLNKNEVVMGVSIMTALIKILLSKFFLSKNCFSLMHVCVVCV